MNKALKQVKRGSQICADMPGSFYHELHVQLFWSHRADLEQGRGRELDGNAALELANGLLQRSPHGTRRPARQ